MRKGQAALEYLMTYGWVFMVIFFTLSALAYFGFLSPGQLLPSKCDMSPGFGCLEHTVEVNHGAVNYVKVRFTNDMNTKIYFIENKFLLKSQYGPELDQCSIKADGSPSASLEVYQTGEITCKFEDPQIADFPEGERVWFSIEGPYCADPNCQKTQPHRMFVNMYATTVEYNP